MIARSFRRKSVASCLLIAALALMAFGSVRTHKVYDAKDDDFAEFGLLTFARIGGRDLVIDATFTGVVRKDGRLYSTYDRTKPRGKKACPT